tara:strand:+ start:14217 stop:20468 length:6252 start_codon:yes stop_codon:yes gene_type:complete
MPEPTPSLSDFLVTPEDVQNSQLSSNQMLVTPSQVTKKEPNYEMEQLALEKAGSNFTLTEGDKSSGMLNPLYGTKVDGVNVDDYSKYIDRPFSFISDDVDEIRAANQSIGEKARYGAAKLVSSVGTNVLGSTVGLLYGGVAFLDGLVTKDANSATKAFFDNNFQRSLDGVNEWMDGKLPHYYTKEEQEYGFLKSMGTANFWTNDFAQGLSFVIGAVMSEGLTAGRTSALLKNMAKKSGAKGKDFIKAINKNQDIPIKGIATAKQVQNSLTTLRQLGTGAMYESGVEARHHYDASLEMLIEAHKAEHDNNPPTDEEMAGLVDVATKSANGVFAGNMALVGYGNFMMFPKIFGKGLNGTKRAFANKIKKQVVDKKKIYSEVFKDLSKGQVMTRKAWKLAKVPLYEGFVEEGGQKLLDLAGQGAAEEFYLSKRNPNMLDMIGELLVHTEDSFSDVYGSKEGQKEIGIGLILGAMGLPGRVSTRGKDGKVTKKVQMQGGIWDTFRDMESQKKAITRLKERLEKDPEFIGAFKKNYDALARATDNQDITDYASIIDNPFISQNAEHDNVFNYLHSRVEAGFEADIIDDIQNVREMSVQEFRDAFNYNEANDYSDSELEARRDDIASALEAKLESIKETMDVMDRSFVNWSSDQKMAAVHALSVAKDSDMREENLMSSIEEALGFPLVSDIESPREETDAQEQVDTKNRVKNIFSRFTKKQKEHINNLPETQTVKQRLGIKEFSDPTHLEELFYEITQKAMSLEEQIEEIGHNDNLDKYVKDSKLIKLAEDKKKLDIRRAQLMKDLNEGLDPNIGGAEQQLLDKWKKENPTGYASGHQDVITKLKDLRKLRARRHRAINMYNQLLEKREVGATLFSEGPLITPPQIRLQQMVKREASENKALFEEDPKLHDLYRRFSDQTIEFDYTKSNEDSPTHYRVFVESKDIDSGRAKVLRQMPTQEVIKLRLALEKLSEKKGKLKYRIERLKEEVTNPDYAQAQSDLAAIDIKVRDLTELLEKKDVGAPLTLDILNSASNIKVIHNSELVREQVEQTIDLVRDNLNIELGSTRKLLIGLNKKFDTLNEELIEKQGALQSNPDAVDPKLFNQVTKLSDEVKILNEAITDVKRTLNEAKTNLQVLQGFEAQTQAITTLPQAEKLINGIYEKLYSNTKVEAYKEVYNLVNKSKIKNLIMTTEDGKSQIDNEKLQRYAEILASGQNVTIDILKKFEPQVVQMDNSLQELEKSIADLGKLLKLNKLKKNQQFQVPSLRQAKGTDPALIDEYEALVGKHEVQQMELEEVRKKFKDELLNIQRAVSAITGLSLDLKNHLYAIKAIIDRYRNPSLNKEDQSEYFDTNLMALQTDDFLNRVGTFGTPLHHRSPITKHGLLRTTGSNVAALKTIERLEQEIRDDVELTPSQVNELNRAKSEASFYKLTSSSNFNTKAYKDGDGDYSVVLISRNNVPADLASELVFFEKDEFKLSPNIKSKLRDESKEEIKAVVLDKEGNPLKVNGVLVYTTMPTGQTTQIKTTVDGLKVEAYRYGEADLIEPKEYQIRDEEGNTRTVFVGDLNPTAKARLKEYKTLRTNLLTSSEPKVKKIKGNSFAMVNKVKKENIVRPSKTFQGSTQNVDLKINTTKGLSISGRNYNFASGTVVAEVNGKPVPAYGNYLTSAQQRNVVNLLKLYATNQRRLDKGEISSEQSKRVDVTDPNSPNVSTVLENIVFFGENTKTRSNKKFYLEPGSAGGAVHFGDYGKIELSKLLSPNENKDLYEDLTGFIGSLRHNVNSYSLKPDQEVRRKSKSRGTWKVDRDAYAKKVKNDKEKIAAWEKKNEYKKSNASVVYDGYTEYIIGDDYTISKVNWTNYTDYLLGDGVAENRRKTPSEIPLYTYLNDYIASDKDLSYNTPQFLNTYLNLEDGYDIGEMLSLDDFKAEKTKTTKSTTSAATAPLGKNITSLAPKSKNNLENKLILLQGANLDFGDTIPRLHVVDGKLELYDVVNKEGVSYTDVDVIEERENWWETQRYKKLADKTVEETLLSASPTDFSKMAVTVDMPAKSAANVVGGGAKPAPAKKQLGGLGLNNPHSQTQQNQKNCKN